MMKELQMYTQVDKTGGKVVMKLMCTQVDKTGGKVVMVTLMSIRVSKWGGAH